VSIGWNEVRAKTELGEALGLYPSLVQCLHPTPTTLDATWVRSEVGTMKGHLSSLIEHAPAHDQFRDMKEAITNGDEEVMAWPALIESYTNGRGWLRSAG
jgi:hypothetical protein